MAESEKIIFRQKSEQDRARFLRQMEEYKNSKSSAQQPASVDQPSPAKNAKNAKIVVPPAVMAAAAKEEVIRLFGGAGSVIENDNIRSNTTWEVTDNVCLKDGCSQVNLFEPKVFWTSLHTVNVRNRN